MNRHQQLCSRTSRRVHRGRTISASHAVQSQPTHSHNPLNVIIPASQEKDKRLFGSLSPLVPIGSLRAFESSLSAARVLEDSRNGLKSFVTASMDKSIAAFRLTPNDQPLPPADPWLSSNDNPSGLLDFNQPPPTYTVEFQKIPAPGGPIFSIAPSRPAANPSSGSTPLNKRIFCGNASKEVISWEPFTPSFDVSMRLSEHTGWVRAVATYDKFLFSCGCNVLRQWDMTYATPKEINTVKLFTGDILSIAVGKGYVFTSGADGSIRGWTVDKMTGEMNESATVERAHGEGHRIYQLTLHSGSLYSCASDGSIKRWTQEGLRLVSEVPSAHGGEKVRCMAVAGNGVLYSGGDDKMIRAWTLLPLPHPSSLPSPSVCAHPDVEPPPTSSPSHSPDAPHPSNPHPLALPNLVVPLNGFEPMQAHATSVRSLVAGASELVVSGDQEGFLSIFRAEGAPMLISPKPHAPTISPSASPSSSSNSARSHEAKSEGVTPLSDAESQAQAQAQVLAAIPVPALSSADRVDEAEFEASLNPVPSSPSTTLPTLPPEGTFLSVDEGGWMDDLGIENLQDQEHQTEEPSAPSASAVASPKLPAPSPDSGELPPEELPPDSGESAPSLAVEAESQAQTPPKPKSVFVDLPPE